MEQFPSVGPGTAGWHNELARHLATIHGVTAHRGQLYMLHLQAHVHGEFCDEQIHFHSKATIICNGCGHPDCGTYCCIHNDAHMRREPKE